MEVAVLQTQKTQELETKLEQQLANIATSCRSIIPRRIPEATDTSTSGGGSTTIIVMKEEMMQMFAKFTQNFQQGQCTKINLTGTKVTGKEKKKSKFGANYIPNDLGNGERSKHRYLEAYSCCPSHGYNIKPDHTLVSCTNRKDFHNKAATINNRMGGVSTNCQFYTE